MVNQALIPRYQQKQRVYEQYHNYHSTEKSDYLMAKSEETIAKSGEGILIRIKEENKEQYQKLCSGESISEIFMESKMQYMHR